MIAVPNDNKGFTLIELLIAMAVSSIVMAMIISAFGSQQKAHVTQQQVVDMQQNIRAAMYLMESEIRMAGYDPTENAGAGIQTAGPGSINLTMDITGGETDGIDNDNDGLVDAADVADESRYGDGDTGDSNENITYSLFDIDGDGDNDLRRADPTVVPAVPALPTEHFLAENIEALGFAYAYDDDNNGQLDTSAGGNVIWAVDTDGDGDWDNLDTDDDGDIDTTDAVGGVDLGTTVNINSIRAVRIWLLARTGAPIRGYSDTMTYVVGDRRVPSGDNFQRRLLTASIKCRNMGL